MKWIPDAPVNGAGRTSPDLLFPIFDDLRIKRRQAGHLAHLHRIGFTIRWDWEATCSLIGLTTQRSGTWTRSLVWSPFHANTNRHQHHQTDLLF
jgi:hypothetical protein